LRFDIMPITGITTIGAITTASITTTATTGNGFSARADA
jgi:hypothetical protein